GDSSRIQALRQALRGLKKISIDARGGFKEGMPSLALPFRNGGCATKVRRYRMTYYVDLEHCTHVVEGDGARDPGYPLLAVGWLEPPHSFANGAVDPNILRRLDLILNSKTAIQLGSVGLYECQFCIDDRREAAANQVAACNRNSIIPGAG